MIMICGPTLFEVCKKQLGPERLSPGPSNQPYRYRVLIQAALRRAGALRAGRRLAVLRRVVPERLVAFFAAGLRREGTFFFADFAMVRSLFLFTRLDILPRNESTILEVDKMSLNP